MTNELRVFASKDALVCDLRALASNVRRFVGRRFDHDLNGWVVVSTPSVVENVLEYRLAVQQGDLIAADEATAKLCGIGFIPILDPNLRRE